MLLFGIGVGPGDPELLTLKAARILADVPVVFYPGPETAEESMALAIARTHIGRRARLVPLPCLSGGTPEAVRGGWRENARAIARTLAEVGTGAFITEGDPLLYSTFQLAWQGLREVAPEVEVVIVPGVTSISAAAARAGFPLASGAEPLAVIPAGPLARRDPERLQALIALTPRLALLKVRTALDRLLPALQESHELVLVERVGLPGEQVLREPTSWHADRLDYMSLLLAGRKA